MPRATVDDVNALMNTQGVDYSFFLNIASAIVDEELAGKNLSAARLKSIEGFLAAHYAVLSKEGGGIRRAAMGQSSETYASISERFSGLNTTRFGQQAVALDASGTLSELASSMQKAEFRVV